MSVWSDLEEDTCEVLSIENRRQTRKKVKGRRYILSSHVLCLSSPPAPPPPAGSWAEVMGLWEVLTSLRMSYGGAGAAASPGH